MEKKHKVVFKNTRPAEFAMGFRTKIAKEIAIIDFVHTEEFESFEDNTKEHHIVSSIAITKDIAADLIKKLQTFVDNDD